MVCNVGGLRRGFWTMNMTSSHSTNSLNTAGRKAAKVTAATIHEVVLRRRETCRPRAQTAEVTSVVNGIVVSDARPGGDYSASVHRRLDRCGVAAGLEMTDDAL